jgi:hypothetical protein
MARDLMKEARKDDAMIETTRPEPPLATARDLAAYHARRDRFYAVAALLLAAPPDRASLTASSRAVDHGASRAGELARALKADPVEVRAEHGRLFGGDAPAIDLQCREPDAPSRAAAAEQAVLPTRPDVATDLRVLATLSDRTASAIEAGDIAEAAALCDVQARFLRQHAGDCIRGLAARLIAADLPFHGALGRALLAQIDEDMRLLAH